MLLPLKAGRMPMVTYFVDATSDTKLEVELRVCSRHGSYTPDRTLARQSVPVREGLNRPVLCAFEVEIEKPQYGYVCLMANPEVSVHLTNKRVTGVLACTHPARGRTQNPPPDIGVESFEFWTPQRRPGGENLALSINPPLDAFDPRSVMNGVARPTIAPNAWVAALEDNQPRLTLEWDRSQSIRELVLGFDTDFDHPMESVLMGHAESEMPFCVRRYRILDDAGNVVYECADNHMARNVVRFPQAVSTKALHIEAIETHGAPAAIFEVRCYA
jgi:hypothetical protein